MRESVASVSRRLFDGARPLLAVRHAIGAMAVGLTVLAALGVSAAFSGGALSTFGRPGDRYDNDLTPSGSRVFLSPEQTALDGEGLDFDAPDVTIELESIDAAAAELSIRLMIEMSEAALAKVCLPAEGDDSKGKDTMSCGLPALEERYWPSTAASADGFDDDATGSAQNESLTMILVTSFPSTETEVVHFSMMQTLAGLRSQRRLTSESVSALFGRDIRFVDDEVRLAPVEYSGSEFYPNDLYEFSINLIELRLTPPLVYRDESPSDAVPARYFVRSSLENDWQVVMEDPRGEGDIGVDFALVRSSTRRAATWLLAVIPLVVVILGMAANRAADSTAMAWGASSIAGLLSLLTVRGIAVPAEIVGVTFFDKVLGVELLIGLSVAAWYLSRIPAIDRFDNAQVRVESSPKRASEVTGVDHDDVSTQSGHVDSD